MEKKALNRALRKQKLKMTLEGILRSLLIGAAAGGLAFVILSWVYRFMVKEPPLSLILAVVLSCAGAAFLLAFAILFFPTKKRVARRVDGHGMDERVTTMLEYSASNADAAKLQRNDTYERLQSGKDVRTGFVFSLREAIISTVCVALAVGVFFIPYNIFAKDPPPPLPEEQQRQQFITDALIRDLREIVKKYDNGEEFEKELNEQIDALEKDFEKSTDALEKTAMINFAAEKLSKSFSKEKDLSLEDEERTGMLSAEEQEMLERMGLAKKQLMQDDKEITDGMIEDLRKIVEEHDNKEDFEKELNEHINDLEKDIEKTANPFEKADKIKEMAEKLEESFDQERKENAGDEEMIEMLNDEEKKMLERMEQAEQQLMGEEPAESEPEPGEGEEPGEEGEGKEKGDGEEEEELLGPNGTHEPGQEMGLGDLEVFQEMIYDNRTGERVYYYDPQVYTYYARLYTDARQSGANSEELQKILDAYFGELSQHVKGE